MYRILVCILIAFTSLKLIECGIKVIADDRFLDDCLYAHNKYRDIHENTQRLRINRTATEYALNRIRSLAKIDGYRPVDQKVVYGENFYWYYDNNGYHSCSDAVDLWYKGRDRYDYNRPGFSDKSGGFSQVVWRGSLFLGCARVEDDTRKYYETYIVCNYYAAGNVDGQYPYNVYPLKDNHDRPSAGTVVSGGSNEWTGDRPIGGHRPEERPPSSGNRPEERPISSGHRPDDRPISSVGHRPDERPIDRPISGHRPISGVVDGWTGDRPTSGHRPVDRPINSGGWTVERPGSGVWTVERPGSSSSRPPIRPPSYPLVYLYI